MMKQLLHPLYNALRSLNEKEYIYTPMAEINDEEESLEDGWLVDILDQTIRELEVALKKSTKSEFSLAITYFGSMINTITADLWNTDDLLIKIIKQMPSTTIDNTIFKSAYYTVSNNKIIPHLSLVSKKKTVTCYQLRTKISSFLREQGYVCLSKNTIKIYDKNKQFKATFNQDGSCNIEKTKANLDKKLRL